MLPLALTLATAALAAPAQTTEFFIIASSNMSPRLEINQRVEFDVAAYASRPPRVGDIVLLHPPIGAAEERCGERPVRGASCATPYGGRDTSVRFVDRVVAVGGDRVSFRRGLVVRNGVPETRKLIRRCPAARPDGCTFLRTITVPAGHVYVAGDNRLSSYDSRYWGALPVAQVLGRYVRTAGTCGC
jgi:signal peptidase I